jgi:hypothetical protein
MQRGIPPRKRRKLDVDVSLSSCLHIVGLATGEATLFAADASTTQVSSIAGSCCADVTMSAQSYAVTGDELARIRTDATSTIGVSAFLGDDRLVRVTASRYHAVAPVCRLA